MIKKRLAVSHQNKRIAQLERQLEEKALPSPRIAGEQQGLMKGDER
jgi:hypothetical protein